MLKSLNTASFWATCFFTMLCLWGLQTYRFYSLHQECKGITFKLQQKKDTLNILVKYISAHNSGLQKKYVKHLANSFYEAGEEFNLDPMLLAAIAHQESHWDSAALSDMGAVGIMQVLPFWVGKAPFLKTSEDLFDPTLNIRAGAYVLRYSIDRCGGLINGLRCYYGGEKVRHKPKPHIVYYANTVMNKYSKMDSI